MYIEHNRRNDGTQRCVTCRSRQGSTDTDETFDIVTEEEIVTSMMDTLPDPK